MRSLDALPKVQPPRCPKVSDHAVLRYLERSIGLDVDAVREAILTPFVRAAIEAGAERLHMPAENVTLIVSRDGTVLTVVPVKGGKRAQ